MKWSQNDINRMDPQGKGEQGKPTDVLNAKQRAYMESRLQIKCVHDFRAIFPEYALNLFAIPNAGVRSKGLGGIMKAEGMLAGVADLFLAVPSGEFHGLFLESKWGDGKLRDNQIEFMERMEAQGYKTGTYWTEMQFWSIITGYLKTDRVKL